MLGVPAVVIGDHGNRRIANLRFARQPRFRHVGHTDYVESKLPVYFRLGQRRELRPFDADISTAAMNDDGLMNAGIGKNSRQLTAGRIRERHVDNDSFSKKSGRSVLPPAE